MSVILIRIYTKIMYETLSDLTQKLLSHIRCIHRDGTTSSRIALARIVTKQNNIPLQIHIILYCQLLVRIFNSEKSLLEHYLQLLLGIPNGGLASAKPNLNFNQRLERSLFWYLYRCISRRRLNRLQLRLDLCRTKFDIDLIRPNGSPRHGCRFALNALNMRRFARQSDNLLNNNGFGATNA